MDVINKLRSPSVKSLSGTPTNSTTQSAPKDPFKTRTGLFNSSQSSVFPSNFLRPAGGQAPATTKIGGTSGPAISSLRATSSAPSAAVTQSNYMKAIGAAPAPAAPVAQSAPVAPRVATPSPRVQPTVSPTPVTAAMQPRDPRIQAMLDQTTAQSSQAPSAPAPTPAPTPAPIQAAGVQTPGNDPYASYKAAIEKLRGGVVELAAPGSEERALQDQLAQFRGDARMGIAGIEGQGRGIPLGLVRGQQAKLQEQAGIQEQTLLDRLAAASAQRQAALEAQKMQLGFAEQDMSLEEKQRAAEQAQLKPFEINGSLVQLNPATGQYEAVYTAPTSGAEGFTLSEGQQRYDAQGNLIAGASDPLKAQKAQLEIQKLQQELATGGMSALEQQIKQLQIQKLQQDVAGTNRPPTAEQSKAAGYAQRLQQASQVIDSIEDQFTGVGSLVGQNLPQILKGEDRLLLEQAQANFINAVLRRESGAAIAPSEFESAKKQYFPQPGDTPAVLAQKKQNRETVTSSMQAESRGRLPGDDIDQFLDSFSEGLSMPGKGSAAQIAAAIKKVESGGNYNARGGSGEFGAYQFMPATWKQWASQFLGDASAPQTAENQDKVAHMKIQSLLDQGYTPEQVALTWNAGSPVRRSGVNRFGVKYDSGAYADKVLAALG